MGRWGLPNTSNYIDEEGRYITQESMWHGDPNITAVVKCTEDRNSHRIACEVDLARVNEFSLKSMDSGYVLFIKNGEDVTGKENVREWLRKELVNKVNLDDGRGDYEYDRKRDDELTEVEA